MLATLAINAQFERTLIIERRKHCKLEPLDAFVSTDLLDRTERQKINWTNSIAFGLLHCGALAALFMFSWHACAVAVFLQWMTARLDISMDYHRLHTDRSYRVRLALEYFHSCCGASASG